MTALNNTVPCTIGKSSLITESIAKRPIPGQLKMYSMKNTPPRVAANDALSVVITGFKEFLSICLKIIFIFDNPLAFAVLTKSNDITSITDDRVILAIIAIGLKDNVTMGRTIYCHPSLI